MENIKFKPGSKEYHALKSREWYQRTKENSPEKLAKRSRYSAQRRKDAKEYWVEKFGRICHFCKNSFPNSVFEFHHVNHKEKDLQPSHMFHLRKEVAELELAKCIMLCANCHRIEHERLKYDAHEKRFK